MQSEKLKITMQNSKMTKQNVKQNENEEEHIEENEEQVDEEIESLNEQIRTFEDKYKRALADYQNLEKRVREEKSEWIRMANRELLLRILPVLDTLLLAKLHSNDQTLKVTAQQFLDVLKEEGIEKIKTEGQEFNPHLMEVISTETGAENKVLKEVRAGYKMGDRILRVAQVVVGKQMN